jgi:hypothetical protein
MSATITALLITAVFAVFGFFLAFSLKRAVNIVVFGIFAFAALKALEYLGVAPNWHLFESLTQSLGQFGKASLDLVKGMLATATIVSILAFLGGGVCGFLVRR